MTDKPQQRSSPRLLRAALNKLEPGFRTGQRIIGHYQIQYIYEGTGTVDVCGSAYSASKGDLFCWGPGMPHEIAADSPFPLIILGAQFTDDTPPGLPHCMKVQLQDQTERTLLEAAREFREQKLYFQEKIDALFASLLYSWKRQLYASDGTQQSRPELIDQVIAYLHAHMHEPLTNKGIADAFHFHPVHLNHLLQTYTGVSLHRYLLNIRINRAADLLAATRMNVGEVARATGFSSIHHFSAAFKKRMGVPPSRFG